MQTAFDVVLMVCVDLDEPHDGVLQFGCFQGKGSRERGFLELFATFPRRP